MKVALLGLMQSGKSTIFSAVSGRALPPIGSTHIEEAIVPIPDDRLGWLTEYYKPKKVTYAAIDCLDLPGLNFSDDHTRAAAGKIFERIRTVDLLVIVIRAFDNPDVPHYKNSIDAARDLEELKTELLLSDLQLVTTRIEKLQKQINRPATAQKHDKEELALHQKLEKTIEAEKPISSAIQTQAERQLIKSLGFLTLKPIIVAVNIGEEQLGRDIDLKNAAEDAADVITISAKIENELSQLDDESRNEFMADLGIQKSALSKFVNSCYFALGLISFLTVGSDEVRAWTIKKGTTALDAADKVHSDIKRGFIRAETFAFEDIKQLGDVKKVKAEGKLKLEGKEYIVNDGDVINFRFNV